MGKKRKLKTPLINERNEILKTFLGYHLGKILKDLESIKSSTFSIMENKNDLLELLQDEITEEKIKKIEEKNAEIDKQSSFILDTTTAILSESEEVMRVVSR